MGDALKIAIIGDYNFTYNSHHATNLSIDQCAEFLDIEINYYWIKINEAVKYKQIYFRQFDAIWIAPGPFQNVFFLNGIFRMFLEEKIPLLITGDAYKIFIEYMINIHQLNVLGEKLISENLVGGSSFERVKIYPKTKEFQKIYENFNDVELTSSRFSFYPKLLAQLSEISVSVDAINQFDDPEIIRLTNHPFFLACSFCPQISSTRDLPHPIIYTLLKRSIELKSVL
ncbi:MAG: hypothetical protein FJY17_10065 [Bacteroidetes bacterium]|nr:hypothetical protein [Bacteroidota bacterium]